MKKSVLALFIVTCCLTASGQFFSDKEKEGKQKEKEAELITDLPEDAQKVVFIEVYEGKAAAFEKSNQRYSAKIHHTPEQRDEQIRKAEITRAKLMALYKADIIKKHNISEDYLAVIMETGQEKGWPQKKKEAPKD
jgi:hypothetical protein